MLLNPWLFALLQNPQSAVPSEAVPGGGASRDPLWHCLPCAPTAEGPCCRERFGQDLISAGGESPLQWGVATGAWCDPMSWGDPSTDWFDLQSQMPVTQVWLLTLVLGRVSAPSAAGTHSFPLSFTLFGKYIIFPQLL